MKTRMVGPLMAVVLAASACGAADASDGGESLNSSDGVASVASDETTVEDNPAVVDEVDIEAQLLRFAACLRGEGFDIVDPTVDADGNIVLPRPTNSGDSGEPGPPAGFAEARDACAEHLEGVTLGFRGGDQIELQDQLLEFAACMRDNGFDLPDPNFSEGGGRGLLQQVDQDDPGYQTAFANCDDILGQLGRGAGAGGGN